MFTVETGPKASDQAHLDIEFLQQIWKCNCKSMSRDL